MSACKTVEAIVCALLAMGCAALPATVQAQSAAAAAVARPPVSQLSVTPSVTSERVPAPVDAARLSRVATVNPALDSSTRQELNLRLWVGSGRTAVGVGMGSTTDFAAPDAGTASSVRPTSLLLAVQRGLGENTRLTLEHASYTATPIEPQRSDLRMGIEFKPVQPLTRMGLSKDSLFRVQLKGTWNLSMRPRSGGVALALRAQL